MLDSEYVRAYNTETEYDVPPWGVAEILGGDGASSLDASGYYRVCLPTDYNLRALVFFGGSETESLTYGPANLSAWPAIASYIPAHGRPRVGEEVGTYLNSWRFSAYSSGYVVIGIDSSDEIVWVVPK